MRPERGLHVVQVGPDDSVFQEKAPSDTFDRQLWYGKLLDEARPGSRLSLLILTRRGESRRLDRGNISFIPVRFRHLWDVWRVYPALESLHREYPIDVISPQNAHDEGWTCLAFAWWHGVPVVGQLHYDLFSPHAREEILGRGIVGRARLWLTLHLLRRFRALRVVGTRIRERVLAGGWHTDVRVIPVPVRMITSEQGLRAHPAVGRRVLFVGMLNEAKNLGDWLRVAARVAEAIPDAEFVIAGDGPARDSLFESIQRLGLAGRVTLLGSVPHSEIAAVYRSSAVFLLTSHFEGFGRVVAEAQTCGLPVVATDITGVQDIVDPGVTGFLPPPGDIAGLADCVIKLLRDEALRERMGEAARRRVANRFDPEHLARAWVGLLVEAGDDTAWIAPPLRATFQRWRSLSSTQYSLLRGLEYERVRTIRLRGKTLDLGGGLKAHYLPLLAVEGSLEGVNIDLGMRPAFVADLNRPLPLCSGCYDSVLSLNTLEHVRDDATAIREALRVLKPGGEFHLFVPFLYRVHASPGDYHRHTASWWWTVLQSHGASAAGLVVEPLVWDPASSGFSLAEFSSRFRGLRKRWVMLGAVLRHGRWRGQERLPHGSVSRQQGEYALGYYINGKKMSSVADVVSKGARTPHCVIGPAS